MILNDELDVVSPGILKDFIELYESRDQFASIEACIVRLKVESFDIHQVEEKKNFGTRKNSIFFPSAKKSSKNLPSTIFMFLP